jgi:hypothetical protein
MRRVRTIRTIGMLAVLGALLTVVLGATAAAAQAPVKEVIQVNDMFLDEGLTEECGVPVTTTATGRVTIFTFPDGKVLQNMTTLNVSLVATAATTRRGSGTLVSTRSGCNLTARSS